jgi:hypothetical protein
MFIMLNQEIEVASPARAPARKFADDGARKAGGPARPGRNAGKRERTDQSGGRR